MRLVPPVLLLLVLSSFPIAPVAASGCGGSNDALDCASEWFAKPESFSNVGATMEPGEPSTCDGETVHRSIWLRLEVLSPGAADPFEVEMTTSMWATFGAYTRATDGTLSLVACAASWQDEDGEQHAPTLYLPCTAGATYWLQVGGRSLADAGSFHLVESQFRKFDGELSEPCAFKATLPTGPRIGAPSPGAGRVVVGWVEPWWDGGRTTSISSYRVYRAPSCDGAFTFVGSTASRAYPDDGLPANATFCYHVTAVNAVGEGPASAARSATTWPLPVAPASVQASAAGDGELAVSWAPASSGPAPIRAYRVYAAAAQEGPFVPLSDAAGTAFTDAGLDDGVTRFYRVSAVNDVGEGPWSGVASATTWAVPGAPRDLEARHRVTIALAGFELAWSAPAEATPFTSYRIYRAVGDGAMTLAGEVAASQTSFADSWREPLTTHRYEVRAANPAGESEPSAAACIVFPVGSPLADC